MNLSEEYLKLALPFECSGYCQFIGNTQNAECSGLRSSSPLFGLVLIENMTDGLVWGEWCHAIDFPFVCYQHSTHDSDILTESYLFAISPPKSHGNVLLVLFFWIRITNLDCSQRRKTASGHKTDESYQPALQFTPYQRQPSNSSPWTGGFRPWNASLSRTSWRFRWNSWQCDDKWYGSLVPFASIC